MTSVASTMSTEVPSMPSSDEKNKFPIPSWAAKAPLGFHLDVLKGDNLIQKLMIDEKKAYYFGRNPQLVDIAVDHASCSRVHALLLYHPSLKRCAIVDLASSHGTFVGNVRVRPLECVFVEVGSMFHLGASTRKYVLREKVEEKNTDDNEEERDKLPIDEQLQNLTEYNTALNRRIPQLSISAEEARRKKRQRGNVSFVEEEEIINPEDVDPTIGRFRNLVSTATISNDKKRVAPSYTDPIPKKKVVRPERNLARYADPMCTSLGSMVMNSAPDLDDLLTVVPRAHTHHAPDDGEPHKKKYAKEHWPGRKERTAVL